MDREHETEQNTGRKQHPRPRSWTRRITGPLRFRRYSDTDAGGTPRIFYRFDVPDQSKLPQPVYDILHELKYLNNNPQTGHGGGRCPTGLTFTRDKKQGLVWMLPDTPTGRTVADVLDAKLLDLAHEMQDNQDKAR